MKNLLFILILLFLACSNDKELEMYTKLTDTIKKSEELSIFYKKGGLNSENLTLGIDLSRSVLSSHDIANLINNGCFDKITQSKLNKASNIKEYSYHLDSILNTVREYKYFTAPVDLVEEDSEYLIRYSKKYQNIVFASVSNWYSIEKEKRYLYFILLLDNDGNVKCLNSFTVIEEEVDF